MYEVEGVLIDEAIIAEGLLSLLKQNGITSLILKSKECLASLPPTESPNLQFFVIYSLG